MNEKFTYEEALCSIISSLHTPITKRKDPDLFECSEIILNKLIKDGIWQKVMNQ